MAFNVILMVNKSEKNRLIKDTQIVQTCSGTLRDETDIINPVIRIECNLIDVVQANYIQIDAFKRKYFITDIVSIRAGLVEFTCHVDVISTYANEILKNNAIIKRQENNWNLLLNDGSFKVYQNPQIVTKVFPNGFKKREYVLAVAGN